MARTTDDILLKETYHRAKLEEFIKEWCEKKGFPVPNFKHGYISGVANDIGVEHKDKEGNSYVYLGADAVEIIKEARARIAKKSGKKQKVKSAGTQNSPSTKPMAKPSQISIDDLSQENNVETLRDTLIKALNIVDSMRRNNHGSIIQV